jgi:hypothetical protein
MDRTEVKSVERNGELGKELEGLNFYYIDDDVDSQITFFFLSFPQ